MRHPNTRLRLAVYFATAAIVVGLFLSVRSVTWTEGNVLRTLYQVVVPAVAFFAGMVALARYYARRSNTFLLVGTGFLGTALLLIYASIMSTAAGAGLRGAEQAGPVAQWCRFSARLLLSAALFASWWAWWREDRLGERGHIRAATAYIVVGGATAAAILLCTFRPMPSAYQADLVVHRPQEVIAGVLFVLALVGYLHKGQWRTDPFDHWLIVFLITAVAAQIAVVGAAPGIMVDPLANWVRLTGALGYLCVLTGLLVSMYNHFVTAERGVTELAGANASLEAQINVRRRAETELRELAGSLEQHVAQRTAELESSRQAAVNIAQDAEESRRRAEAAAGALRESEARTRAVLDTVLDGIITIDRDGTVVTFNPGATRTFGYQPQEIIGHNVRELMPPPYREQHDQYLGNYLQTGVKKIIGIGREVVGRRRDGSGFPMELAVAEMTLGGRTMFVGVVRDITQRERHEQALRASEARFRAMVDASPLGVFLSDTEGRSVYGNTRLEEIRGLAPEAALGLGWTAVLHPDDRARVVEAWTRAVETRTPYAQTYRFVHPEGAVVWVIVKAAPIFDNDQFLGFVGSVDDVTERRRAEEHLRQAHGALERKYEEMEEFLSIVAHDLKHPVVGIQGLLSLIKEDCGPQLDLESSQNLDMSLGECERMKEMLAHLSHLGRIEGVRPTREHVRLDQLVRASTERFRAQIQKREVNVQVEAQPAEAVVARGHLEEALTNLIDNAFKYGCAKPGSRLDVGCRVDGDWGEVWVADDGPGIDPRFHQRVFQPFRRLSGHDAVSGSGMGLTAVRRLMQRIGGTVTLESKPGHGARFSLRFPLEYEAP